MSYLSVNNDKLFTDADSDILNLIKDNNKNVRYIKVTSQEDYNQLDISNDTLYFINDITDIELSLHNVLDVAVTNTHKTDKPNNYLPEQVWILTADEEIEEVDLWRSDINFTSKGRITGFKLVKRYPNCKDGRIALDGTFEYIDSDVKATFITRSEPFVAVITNEGKLYGIPNLKYDVSHLGEGEEQAWLIAGTDDEGASPYVKGEVVTCSVERGYFANTHKSQDQGMVVVYALRDGNQYTLNYIQYGYTEDNNPIKSWGPHRSIKETEVSDEHGTHREPVPINYPIYWIAIRRLTDYRLGITYNYWSGDTSVAKFVYSERTYPGIAYRPEVIKINQKKLPQFGTIVYGAVRNDNIARIERPFLNPGREATTTEEGIKLEFQFYTSDPNLHDKNVRRVPIDLINPEDPTSRTIPYGDKKPLDIGLAVVNTFNYADYETVRDPYFGDKTHAVAAIKRTDSDANNKIIVILNGPNLPMTPFRLIPDNNWGSRINIRFDGSSFNELNIDDSLLSGGKIKIQGWFALDGLQELNIGKVHTVTMSSVKHIYDDYESEVVEDYSTSSTVSTVVIQEVTFRMGVSWGYSSSQEMNIVPVEEIRETADNLIVNATAMVPLGISIECVAGRDINV